MRNFTKLVLLVGFHFSSWAQDLDTLTLESALATALENNFQIRLAKNNSRIAQNNNSLGNAGFLPIVTAQGRWDNSVQNTEQEFLDGRTQSVSGAEREQLTLGADLAWTVFDGLVMFAARDRLANQSLLARQELKVGVDNAMAEVMNLFYSVALEQERLALFESNIDFSENRVTIVQQKYDVGKESKLSLLQAKVDLNADRSALLQQQELLALRKLSLLRSIGVGADASFGVSYELKVDSLLSLPELLDDAKGMNPNLQREVINQRVLEQQRLELVRGRIPQLDVNLGYSYSDLESEAGFLFRNQTDGFSYGLSARVTVFDGLNRERQIQNAVVQQENTDISFENVQNEIETNIRTVFNTYRNNLRLQQLERDNLEVARENSDIALERFRLGASDALELREAQVNAVNAEIRFLQSVFNSKLAEIELQRLSGRISEQN